MTKPLCRVCQKRMRNAKKPLCEWCARRTPKRLLDPLEKSWPRRVRSPYDMLEALAAVRQWHITNPHRD